MLAKLDPVSWSIVREAALDGNEIEMLSSEGRFGVKPVVCATDVGYCTPCVVQWSRMRWTVGPTPVYKSPQCLYMCPLAAHQLEPYDLSKWQVSRYWNGTGA